MTQKVVYGMITPDSRGKLSGSVWMIHWTNEDHVKVVGGISGAEQYLNKAKKLGLELTELQPEYARAYMRGVMGGSLSE